MDKLLDALRETLAKLGLDESAIDAALQEAVAKAEGAEGDPAEGDPANPVDEVTPTDPAPEVPADETPGEVPPSADPSADEVPPAEGEPVVPPTEEVPPVNPVEPAPAPAFDPAPLMEQITTLQGQLEEQLKANEGLAARVQALEEALKTAGVIDGNQPIAEVGDENPSAAPQSPTDDVFGSVLSELNGHKRF